MTTFAATTATTAKALTLTEIKCHLDIKDHNYGRLEAASVKIGNWDVTTSQYVFSDRNCYSKGWHRSYGAKFSVGNRKVTFKRKHGVGFLTRSTYVSSWSTNFLENAIVELGLGPKNPKLPLSIRLHKAFDAKLIKTVRGHRIYQRTLLGATVDYVIVAPMGTTYHCDIYKDLIKGLYAKIRAAASVRFSERTIDWKACKELGFCSAGIKEFCSAFGLDYKEKYSVEHIAKLVRAKKHIAAPFYAELKTLAAAFNYKI
ncbi:MAG: hypothetical protein ACRC1W_00230 [Shewanella sp.]